MQFPPLRWRLKLPQEQHLAALVNSRSMVFTLEAVGCRSHRTPLAGRVGEIDLVAARVDRRSLLLCGSAEPGVDLVDDSVISLLDLGSVIPVRSD